MKRSAVLGIALLGALGASARAQQAGKLYRVGILSGRSIAVDRPFLDAFRRRLSSLGYEEGTNLEIVYRGAGGNVKRLPQLASELVRTKPDAIAANGSPAIAAAKRATGFVPIVMNEVADPVGSGFVTSLARPGGNLTGLTNMAAELGGKRLQLLKELHPSLKRVAVTWNALNPASLTAFREVEREAHGLGIAAAAVDIESSGQIDAAFKMIPQLHADGVIVFPDSVMLSIAPRVVGLVAGLRLPAVYANSLFTAAGGLMYYGPSVLATWIQTATYVDRILKGAKPADLPVQQPTTFDLVVNLKTAHALGLTVPQSILLQATQVIR